MSLTGRPITTEEMSRLGLRSEMADAGGNRRSAQYDPRLANPAPGTELHQALTISRLLGNVPMERTHPSSQRIGFKGRRGELLWVHPEGDFWKEFLRLAQTLEEKDRRIFELQEQVATMTRRALEAEKRAEELPSSLELADSERVIDR